MKKLLLFSLLVLTMVSCTINEDEPDTYWKVVNVAVAPSDWVRKTDLNGLNAYYTCTVDMPEITSFVYTSGLVQAYFVDDVNGAQASLPYVRHKENNTNLWTTTYDSEYSVGAVSFFVTRSDFANVPPGNMSFRVVVMW